MNNLYHWDKCYFNTRYLGGNAIGYAPDLEAAIQNILASCREEYCYLKWSITVEESDSDFSEKIRSIEEELRSREPSINPPSILIEGSE